MAGFHLENRSLHWPWGNIYDKSKRNAGLLGGLAPVAAFLDGANEYGLFGLSGNAWSWICNFC